METDDAETQHPSPQTPLGAFSVLPLELCQEIWTMLLPIAPINAEEGTWLEPHQMCPEHISERAYRWSKRSNCLHYSRTIYREASDMLYRRTSAVFSLFDMTDKPRKISVVKFHHPILGHFWRRSDGSILDPDEYESSAALNIPWHRFSRVELHLHSGKDLHHVLTLHYAVDHMCTVLAESFMAQEMAQLDIAIFFRASPSGKEPWHSRLQLPDVPQDHVILEHRDAICRPVLSAVAALSKVIAQPSISVHIDHPPGSAIASELVFLESSHILDIEASSLRPSMVCIRPSPATDSSHDREPPIRRLQRHTAAMHEYLLDYLPGNFEDDMRSGLEFFKRRSQEVTAVANIAGRPRAAELSHALCVRQAQHLFLAGRMRSRLVWSAEWQDRFRKDWPDDRVRRAMRIHDGWLQWRREFEGLIRHEWYLSCIQQRPEGAEAELGEWRNV